MKKGMCKGCNNLKERIQLIRYDENEEILDVALEIIKPYCTHYRLHLDMIERIHKGVEKCPRYYDGNFHE